MVPKSEKELNEYAFAKAVIHLQEAGVTREYPENFYAPQKGYHAPANAFQEVVTHYQDSSLSASSISAVDFSRPGSDGGKVTHSKNTFKERPTLSDYVCDVEINARRVLSLTEFSYFRKYYLVEMLPVADPEDTDDWFEGQDAWLLEHLMSYDAAVRDEVASMDQGIRERLGARFIEVGIYPTTKYFDKQDIRIKRERGE